SGTVAEQVALNKPMENKLESFKPYSITLSVADIEKTAKWYVEKLGFKIVQRKSYPEFNTSLIFTEKNGFRIELIKDGNATSGTKRADPPAHTSIHSISQFAFETDDVLSLKQELLERDVPIAWEFENAELGVRFLFVRDPEGNLIQFLQRLK
ncbi:MAG TPA: VOC family protein, partial [Pyrinomonadaceae bacterium]|nr:VOC family protein [Pyrinomonadaceae bacterium]